MYRLHFPILYRPGPWFNHKICILNGCEIVLFPQCVVINWWDGISILNQLSGQLFANNTAGTLDKMDTILPTTVFKLNFCYENGYSDSIFTSNCCHWSNQWWTSTGSDNGLMAIGWQAIIRCFRLLTHICAAGPRRRDKIAEMLQTMHLNAFSWMKIF